MEIKVLKEDKNSFELEVKGEGHTLCNLLRKQLFDDGGVKFSSYSIKHPLVSDPVVNVHGAAPRKTLIKAAENSRKLVKEFKTQLKKF